MAKDVTTGSVSVVIASDSMSATMRFEPDADGAMLDEGVCIGALETQSIPINPDIQRRVGDFLAALRLQPATSFEALVATGSPPVHGIDGRLEFEPDFDPNETEDSESEKKPATSASKSADASDEDDNEVRVDYYSRSAFILVHDGDVIGKLIPATEGEPGETVAGKAIAAKPGKAFHLTADESIEQGDGGVLTARVDGVLHFDGKRLRVLTELAIDEYVDFSTGNIEFPGDVLVRRGVRDRFHVHADGDLRVEGLVEAADLTADHNIALMGGMSGRHKGVARSGHDLSARYLDATHVHVGNNLCVDKELNDCQVDVAGAIESPGATIVGGDVYACRGVEVAVVGQDDAHTFVAVGQSRDLAHVLNRADEVLAKLHDDFAPAQREYDMLMKNMAKLTGTQAERLTELQFIISTRRDQISHINKGLDDLNEMAEEYVRPMLVAHKRIWAGTKMRLGRFVVKFKTDLKGPLRIDVAAGRRPMITDLTSNTSSDLSDVAQVWKEDEPEEGAPPDSAACAA